MFKLSVLARTVAAVALATCALGAVAGTTYGDIAAPGVVFGSGNVNGDFTIGTAGGVELGLRTKNYGGATIDGSSGVYTTTTGGLLVNANPLKVRALWNYEFTINSGVASLSDYTFLLGVDQDASAAAVFTFVNAISYFGDNASGGFSNVSQNSENVIFDSTPGGAFDLNKAGLYDFSLTAFDASGVVVDQVVMRVDVVDPMAVALPEPASLALLALALGGAMVARRRKQGI